MLSPGPLLTAPGSCAAHTWTLQEPGTPWPPWPKNGQFSLFPSPTETRVEFFQRLFIGKTNPEIKTTKTKQQMGQQGRRRGPWESGTRSPDADVTLPWLPAPCPQLLGGVSHSASPFQALFVSASPSRPRLALLGSAPTPSTEPHKEGKLHGHWPSD